MNNTNITKVYLLSNVPLENDYKNTLYFDNLQNQQTYFESKISKSYTNFSYQRKDSFIRVPDHFDNLQNINYVMYQNTAFSNKWFYAFVTDIKYVSSEKTDLYIEIDYMQTWLFDYDVKSSFIEREHVNDDTMGLNTIPENLETGEFVCNELSRDNELSTTVYVILTTKWVSGTDDPLAVNMGGIFMAGGAYICNTIYEVINILSALSGAGHIDAISAVYMVPSKIVNNTSGALQYSGQSDPVTYTHTISKQTTLNGYTPRNKKLLCFPYNYILMSNNAGTSNTLQYELFSTNDCQFEIAGVPVIGGSIKCVPLNYKGIARIQEEGIMLGKFPTLSWSADLYTNWLTQNAVNIGLGLASDIGQIVAGTGIAVASGGLGMAVGGSSIVSGLSGIANTLAQVHQQSFTPNSARGNINGGDINTCYDMNKFYFYKMSIKQEYAKLLDKYFDMFGYKVNMVKVPNKNHRSKWWYTKTIDVNIDGNIPNKDIQIIKNCYNNGITFWRNPTEIQNYSLTNGIV